MHGPRLVAAVLFSAPCLVAQPHDDQHARSAPHEHTTAPEPDPANAPVSAPPEALPVESHHHDEPIEVVVKDDARDPHAASRLVVGRRELDFRPKRRPSDILEAAPGLFVAQHAGGGKATQFFLRGFDADHGTDVAFYADGIPINFVSHGHGQGYSDLNFIVPELVVGLDIYKGPYYAELGDFATAGAVNLRLVEVFPESFASYSLGQYGVQRIVLAASPNLGEGWRNVVAGEITTQDGPFENPERYRRFNVFLRTTRDLGLHSKLALTWMSYGGRWNGSGQIPARAVCGEGEAGLDPPSSFGEPCLDRFGSVDPSEGGQTQRHTASVAYSLDAHGATISALAYATKYRWNLYSNFTFFDRDPINGDGIEQTDDRVQIGGDFRVRRHVHFVGSQFTTNVGIQVRADSIDNGLYDQRARERIRERVRSNIEESQIGVFAEEDLRLTKNLRFIAGLRIQRIDAAVEDQREDVSTLGTRTSGSSGATLTLPKLTAVVSPVEEWELFGNAGRGFHSNDARGTVLSTGRVDLMTPAMGYEVGTRVRPMRGLSLYTSAFLLDLDSEQVWVGDEGTTEASAETRRTGVEIGARAHLWNWFFADLDATFTRAVFVSNAGNGSSVALAPTRTLTAGVGVRPKLGDYTPFGALRVKSLADRPATEDESLTAEGYTLIDAEAGLRWSFIEAAIDVQNVLGTTWREVNFATESRMGYEPAPVTGIHYAPGWPRTVIGRVTLYWP
ncbi:MAG: TonB-dependent receptor [Myxococcales bacterium]|nr:TonB-dependent receptor [Myxococcales bacterium]